MRLVVRKLFRAYYCNLRRFSEATEREKLRKVRTIGLLAHIDAGKTTTTERMLFFSGKISSMGEVHYGNTVTDFMDQERERGITIASAVVTFPWKGHSFNLVDTPGHIDFTMEVEQSLGVLDSVVIILDSSAGVEAQTKTVWSQSHGHKLPKLIYANKFDRKDSDLDLCIKDIQRKLSSEVFPVQLPIIGKGGFMGVIDLVSLEEILWSKGACCTTQIDESHASYETVMSLRTELVDKLSGMDDRLAELILEKESLQDVSSDELRSAVRRATISLKGVPLVCGSSFKNIGVQSLLDSIVHYLPSPLESHHEKIYPHFKNHLAARAFKIVHDKQRGPITFLRVFNGTLSKGQKVHNANQSKSDVIGKLLVACADDFQEVSSISKGHFGAALGIKGCMSGDLVCGSASSVKHAKEGLVKYWPESEIEGILKCSPFVPEPVFFCSIETDSQSYQLKLERALAELQVEDPSLRVKYDPNTGQTVLGGLGELHLEIIKDRLKKAYKLDVYTGPLEVAYKERMTQPMKQTLVLKHAIGSSEQFVNITLSLLTGEGEFLTLDGSSDAAPNLARLTPKNLNIIKKGIQSALSCGPLFSCPVIEVRAILHWFELGRGTSEASIAAAASQCTSKALSAGATRLLEPVMSVVVVSSDDHSSSVISDLSRRRATMESVVKKNNMDVEIRALTPLSELLGYAKDLRSITSGSAQLFISFSHYSEMSPEAEGKVIGRSVSL